MIARTYRAGTMKEALAQVRRDLGGDAVILATREVSRRRLFGLGRRELIEVTASDSSPVGKTFAGPHWAPGPVATTAVGVKRVPVVAVAGASGALQAHFGEQLGQ